jgi:hypothetical protein
MKAKKKAVKRVASRRASAAAKKSVGKPAAAKYISLNLPRIGAEWPGQGGRLAGIIRGEDGQPDHALVVSTHKNGLLKGTYGPLENIKDAQHEYDGMANTRAMAAVGSGIAKQALSAKIDGHADFYIPSRREARLAYVNTPECFEPGWNWTSTQSRAWDGHAWAQGFEDGDQNSCRKDDEFPVRLVRRVPIR